MLSSDRIETRIDGPERSLPDALPELPLAVQDVLRRPSTDAGGLAQALFLL
jgi:hypothetical protein